MPHPLFGFRYTKGRRKSRCAGISQSDHQDRGFLNTNTFITQLPQQLSILGIRIRVPCTNSVILEVLKTLNLLDIPAHRDFRLAGTTLKVGADTILYYPLQVTCMCDKMPQSRNYTIELRVRRIVCGEPL